MARKKKIKEDIEEMDEKDLYDDKEDESSTDDFDEEDDFDDNKTTVHHDNFSDDNVANNALQYASIISTPSQTSKHFKHIPKEARYSFLDAAEVREMKHWDKNYRNYKYLLKVLKLQEQEDIEILKNRLKLYEVKTKEDFKEYCRINNMLICYNNVKNNDESIKLILAYISNLVKMGFYDDINNQNDVIKGIYNKYRKSNKIPRYVDDLGMAGNILASSVISMGRDGNERISQVTTVSATRDIDLRKEQEEKTDYKNKIKGVLNKFR